MNTKTKIEKLNSITLDLGVFVIGTECEFDDSTQKKLQKKMIEQIDQAIEILKSIKKDLSQ